MIKFIYENKYLKLIFKMFLNKQKIKLLYTKNTKHTITLLP